MNKKVLIGGTVAVILLALVLLAYFLWFFDRPVSEQNASQAQNGKVYRVGIISGLDFFASTTVGFKEKMTELGYIEGKNIIYELESTNLEPEKEKQILKRFVDDKVDLILSFPTEVALEAKDATKGTTIPVVFADAYVSGVPLIDSIQQPGGNITGVQFPGAEISIQRLEFLHQILPNVKRVYTPYAKDYPPVPPMIEKVRAAASTLGITLVEMPGKDIGEVEADLTARDSKRDVGFDAILRPSEPFATVPELSAFMAKFADKHKLMIVGSTPTPGDTGSVFINIPDATDVGGQAGILADKIFKGQSAGTIPVVTPETYLTVNYRVAEKLGITLPEGFLAKATQILK